MNAFRSIGAATRRLSILLAIILLVSLFLFLYYFKYVPANKERLQRQGFLMLQQQENGIQQNLLDLKSYFDVQKQLFDKEMTNKKYKDTSISKDYKEPFNYTLKYFRKTQTKTKTRSSQRLKIDSYNPSTYFDLDEQNVITFQFNNIADSTNYAVSDSTDYTVSLDQLFEKILGLSRLDFFQSHLVICKRHAKNGEENEAKGGGSHHAKDSSEEHPHIIYHSPELSASEQLEPDSLGRMLASAQFSKIINLEINGSRYKAFMLPFQLEHNTLILTGLMPETEYQDRLQNIPFGTVSIIIIIFIFILICLPYIKVFFISKEEHFGIRDIVFLGITLFIGTAILLIILQQLLMQTGAQLRTKSNLYSLSNSINAKFHNDISLAYSELKYLDLMLAQMINSPKIGYQKNKDAFKTKLFVKKLKPADDSGYILPFRDSNNYLNYDLVYWANDSGQQVYKGRFDDTLYSFSNISYRQYFKDVKTKHLYSFTDKGGDLLTNKQVDSFTIQPVYSMSSNAFEVNIAIPSRLTGTMAALSAYMYSVMNTVIPRGYGFYIIDNKGLIQFQSEGTVTLQENFLEWINDHQNLANIIKNRQSRFIPNQYINDKQYTLFVRPLDQLPLHLIVYYCNDHNTASILHINAFILFFLFILYSMLFLFFIIAWNKTNYFSRLNQPIYQYDSIKPGKGKSKFLFAANCYLMFYIFITLGFDIFIHKYSAIWFIGLMFPIFAVWTLYLLFRLDVDRKNPSSSSKSVFKKTFNFLRQPYNFTPVIFLFLLNFIYFRIETNPISWAALIFYEVISFLLMPVVVVIFSRFTTGNDKEAEISAIASKEPSPFKKIVSNLLSKKTLQYNTFWFLCVIAISVIPVNCFFIYAQQKEIALLVKANQIDMAENIENRLSKFGWFDKVAQKREISEKQKDSIFFNQGIYDDSCVKTSIASQTTPNKINVEPYDKVIRSISWKYHSQDKMLPGQDTANDMQWYRQDSLKREPKLMTLVYNLRPENKTPDFLSKVSSLQIRCSLPSILHYYRMNNFITVFLILLFSILLLILFYRLIKTIAGRLFHAWNFKGEGDSNNDKDNLIRKQLIKDDYPVYSGIEEVLKKDQNNSDEKYTSLKKLWQQEYKYEGSDKTKITEREDDILYNQYHLSAFYEKLWRSCSNEEKYFLYDMSRDGFINYKKVSLVQQLLYKGLLINCNHEEMKIMGISFRNYILDKKKSEEISKLKDQFHIQGTWGKLRTPVLIAITAIGTFLFITQQDLIQRVAALVPTLSAILGLGTLILGSKTKG